MCTAAAARNRLAVRQAGARHAPAARGWWGPADRIPAGHGMGREGGRSAAAAVEDQAVAKRRRWRLQAAAAAQAPSARHERLLAGAAALFAPFGQRITHVLSRVLHLHCHESRRPATRRQGRRWVGRESEIPPLQLRNHTSMSCMVLWRQRQGPGARWCGFTGSSTLCPAPRPDGSLASQEPSCNSPTTVYHTAIRPEAGSARVALQVVEVVGSRYGDSGCPLRVSLDLRAAGAQELPAHCTA